VLAVACLVAWMALGANRGWTRTSQTRMEKDPVTEIEFPVVEKGFSPGVELLGAGLLSAAVLAFLSFFIRNKPNPNIPA
jgi:hypothetical protein